MKLRIAVGLVCLLGTTACGQGESSNGAERSEMSTKSSTAARPPRSTIRKLDEPASPEMVEAIQSHANATFAGGDAVAGFRFGETGDGCSYRIDEKGEIESSEGSCSPQELREVRVAIERERRERAEYEKETALAEGTTPRVVASLQLSNAETAFFVVYRARTGRDCGFTITSHDLATEPLGTGVEGGLPCWRKDRCDVICVGSQALFETDTTSADPQEEYGFTLLSGTIAAQASDLRIRSAGGESATIPITGPLLYSDPSRRIVLVENDAEGLRYEALDGDGNVIATYEEP